MTRKMRKEMERERQIRIHHEVLKRRKMCEDKKRYDTDVEAWARGKFLNATEYKDNPRNFKTYWCHYCNGFHLTSHG